MHMIRDQSRPAVENVDEFILLAVTMQECRLTPWEQRRQVYAEVLEAKHIAKRALLASCHPAEERLSEVAPVL